MIRRSVLAVLLAAALAACAATSSFDATPSPASSPPVASPEPPAASASPASPSASATSGAPGTVAGIDVPDPGRPFIGADILAAMAGSRRPGGVPDALETEAIAAAIAERIWTLDGAPWQTITAGGSCGPDGCTLEVAGGRADLGDEDVWILAIDPGTGTVGVRAADLHGVPTAMVAELDRLARTLAGSSVSDTMLLTSVRWLPPPEPSGRFVLAYRAGDEEGSCSADVTIDARAPALLEVESAGC